MFNPLIVKHFNTALKLLVASSERSAATIAEQAGISAPMFSRITTGTPCSDATAGAIIRAFPEQLHRHHLITAWITDRAADAALDLAAIRAAIRADTSLHIPPQIREPLEQLLREAEHNPDLLDLIETLANTLTTARLGAIEAVTATPYTEVAESPSPVKLPPPKPVSYTSRKKRK